MNSSQTPSHDGSSYSLRVPIRSAETAVHAVPSLYHFALDYHPERRLRRWSLLLMAPDERERDYHCWTHAGAERLRRRVERRTSNATRRLTR